MRRFLIRSSALESFRKEGYDIVGPE